MQIPILITEQLRARLHQVAEVVSLDVAKRPPKNPWAEFAGMFKDDPYFDEWQRAIAENRRGTDEDPEIP